MFWILSLQHPPVPFSEMVRLDREPKAASDRPADAMSGPLNLRIPVGKDAVSQENDDWYLQTDTGDIYGPVSKQEMDQWQQEKRIGIDYQILQAGSGQWQWANDVYPQIVKKRKWL